MRARDINVECSVLNSQRAPNLKADADEAAGNIRRLRALKHHEHNDRKLSRGTDSPVYPVFTSFCTPLGAGR